MATRASVATAPSSESLYSQLGSVMEELANAAVAEICRLVDEGFAVLRLEMTRSHRENEALRKKLKELQVSCGAGRDGRRRDGACPDGEAWRGQQMELRSQEASEPPTSEEEPADLEKERPSLLIMKEEAPDEDVNSAELQGGRQSAVDSSLGCRDSFAVTHHITPAEAAEDLSRQQRTGQGLWECSQSETVLKVDGEKESESQELKEGGPEWSTGAVYRRGSDAQHERPSPVRNLPSPGSAHISDSSCSYSTDAIADSSSLHSDWQPLPIPDRAAGDKRNVKTEAVSIDFVHVKEDDLRCVLQSSTMSAHTQSVPYGEGIETVVIQSAHVSLGSCEEPQCLSCMTGRENTAQFYVPRMSDFLSFDIISSKSAKTQQRMGLKEKRFFCKYCGMGFSFLNEVQMHQRRHTGEKPFSCELCDKRFSQASYLKVHQRVHTGEKPFRCEQCGKSFGQSGYLNVHQRIHTGEKPFSCTQCGKSFTRSNHLKRHQSVHAGEKLFTVAS